MGVEYGVMHHDLDGLHRGPWTREEAEEWIREAVEDGFKEGVWLLASRQVSEWAPVVAVRDKCGPSDSMRWTKDGRYFGSERQVEAYDRGEPVVWENHYGTPDVEVVNPSMRKRIDKVLGEN